MLLTDTINAIKINASDTMSNDQSLSEQDIFWLHQQPGIGVISEDEEDDFVTRVGVELCRHNLKDARLAALEHLIKCREAELVGIGE